jgi:ribosomal protein S1
MTINTMEELLKKYGTSVKGFKRGQKIEAKVVEINKKSAIFDVGGKSEGILKDIYFQEARDYLKSLKVGDTVNALVMDPETSEGNVVLSLRHAAADSLWERLNDIKSKGTALSVNIKNSNQSGISVDFEGINGFIPSSQIGKALLKNIDNINGSIRVKIIEIDKGKKKVVFSEKAVSEEKEMKELEKNLTKIKTGEIYTGKITTITSFGVFVEIKDGIEGLVHVSESSWEKVNKPSDMFKVGEAVTVKVLGSHDGKLSLSIKQAQKDPWEDAIKKLKVEDKVKGKVTKSSDFGTFVQILPGIEGLIHITKIPPATKLNIGDEVNVYIEEIDTKNKKISLGIVLTAKPIGYK